MNDSPSVIVTTAPHGFKVSGSGYVLDVFEPDVLTMTAEESGRVDRVFQPDEWQEARQMVGDYTVYVFRNERYAKACAARVEQEAGVAK